jgi:hypothetical protein
VVVTGGIIEARLGNAIAVVGYQPKILITGGYLSNEADKLYPTVVAYELIPKMEALLEVSGTAKIEAKKKGSALVSSGLVKVSGNAQVSSADSGETVNGTITSSFVEISDNANISAINNNTIVGYQTVLVQNNAIVEAKNNTSAIYLYGEGGGLKGIVEIKDNAQVLAENKYAVTHNVNDFTLKILGGSVFAYGKDLSDVINDPTFLGTDSIGLVLAWNKEAGNLTYEKSSSEDIFISTEDAVAYWDKKGNLHGIYYENGSNTGFIPIEGVSVEEVGIASTTLSNQISVYPNPTTGQLRITASTSSAANRALSELALSKLEVVEVMVENYSLFIIH